MPLQKGQGVACKLHPVLALLEVDEAVDLISGFLCHFGHDVGVGI